MSDIAIFILGAIVSSVTLVAVISVGLGEAADPAHSRPEDLTDWERSLVAEQRDVRES